MSEMVKKVARALADSRYMNIGGANSTALGKPAWVFCVPDALIAIEAMREPTIQMTQAACDATFGPVPLSPEAAHSIGYRAMISAALSEVEG